MSLKSSAPRTVARILSVVKEKPRRGMELRAELLGRYGMSDSTRAHCMRKLLASGLIAKKQVGSGRSAEYSVTASGRRWLRRYLSRLNSALDEKYETNLPVCIGIGELKVSYQSNSAYLAKVYEAMNIVHQRELNRILSELAFREMSRTARNNVRFRLEFQLDTELSSEVRLLWHILRKAREKLLSWRAQKEKHLSSATIKLTSDKQALMCILDYFTYCPVGVLEATLIQQSGERGLLKIASLEHSHAASDLELVGYGLAKWRTLPAQLRGQVKSIWEAHASETYTKKPPEIWRMRSLFDQELELFYDPDFRLPRYAHQDEAKSQTELRQTEDFSKEPLIDQFVKALESVNSDRWMKHLSAVSGRSVYDPLHIRNGFHRAALLVNSDLLDTQLAPSHGWEKSLTSNVSTNSLNLYDVYMGSVRLNLHECVRNNDIVSLWRGFFLGQYRAPMDDHTWFIFWGWMRGELVGSVPQEIGAPPLFLSVKPSIKLDRFLAQLLPATLPTLREMPPFFMLLDRLYIRWLNAGKPLTKGWNVKKIIEEVIRISGIDVKQGRGHSAYKLTPSRTARVAERLAEFVNELEWDFETDH